MSALAHTLAAAPHVVTPHTVTPHAALAAPRTRPANLAGAATAPDDTELSDDALEHVVGGLARLWPAGAFPLLSDR